jgi:hypothetical protein
MLDKLSAGGYNSARSPFNNRPEFVMPNYAYNKTEDMGAMEIQSGLPTVLMGACPAHRQGRVSSTTPNNAFEVPMSLPVGSTAVAEGRSLAT